MGSGGSYFFVVAAGRERELIFFYKTKIVFYDFRCLLAPHPCMAV